VRMRELRAAAWERQGGRCAVTGHALGGVDGDRYHLHHRRPSGAGGTRRADQDSLGNVVCLLPRVHVFGAPDLIVDGVAGRSVHGDPLWSTARGLLLPARVEDPASVPVWMCTPFGGPSWWLLSADGGFMSADVSFPAPG
jgi:hypothetical protein